MTEKRQIPIYTSAGDCLAYLSYPYVFDVNGDWIAFVTDDRNVYSVNGDYIGWITDDPRIVRTVSSNGFRNTKEPPVAPLRIKIKLSTSLAPMMSDLLNSQIDVLQDEEYKFIAFGRFSEE